LRAGFDLSALDLIRWEIAETVLLDPMEGSNPVYDEGPERYIRSYEAPSLTRLAPVVVVFRIDRFPVSADDGTLLAPGEVTGLLAYPE
jgi:hypothetical protein